MNKGLKNKTTAPEGELKFREPKIIRSGHIVSIDKESLEHNTKFFIQELKKAQKNFKKKKEK